MISASLEADTSDGDFEVTKPGRTGFSERLERLNKNPLLPRRDEAFQSLTEAEIAFYQSRWVNNPFPLDIAADVIPTLMEFGGKLPFESMIDLTNRRSRFHKFVATGLPDTGRATVLSQTVGAITFSVETVSLAELRGDYECLDFAGRINFLARLVKFADRVWTMEVKITSSHIAQHRQKIVKSIRSWFEEGRNG